MNEMRKLMEAVNVLTERPIEHGDSVEYKGNRYTVVGINLNDWDQILIQRDGTDREGWVNINKLTKIAKESEVDEEIIESEIVEEIDIDTFLENLETSVKNMISK